MSETEEKVYKQTYSLDENESDSDSSVEVHYIQASDLPPDELARILATYTSSLQSGTGEHIAEHSAESDEDTVNSTEAKERSFAAVPAPSWLRAAYDEEDGDDETKLKTVVYKTTYKTSNEEQSGSEASHDEDSEEDIYNNGVSYKTVYKTYRTRDSSPEICNDDDPDYEPGEEYVKRNKKLRKMKDLKLITKAVHSSCAYPEIKPMEVTDYKKTIVRPTEKQSSPKELPRVGTDEEDPTANMDSIEVQPTPGADFIKIPVPVRGQQKHTNAYRKEWEDEAQFKDWIQPWLDDSMYAYCKFCKCKLIADKKNLKDHSNTKKHRKNVFDATGVWDGSYSEPPNLNGLMPLARMRTEQIFLNNYDGLSFSFANSSEFNARSINDPLLPIS